MSSICKTGFDFQSLLMFRSNQTVNQKGNWNVLKNKNFIFKYILPAAVLLKFANEAGVLKF